MKRCGIYLIEHTESGMRYVGQSRDIERRLREHGNGHMSSKGHLRAAVSKYGWQAFSVRVLEECDSAALNGVEVMWIADLDTQHPRGYNLTSGGGQSTCISAETRARMSASKKGIPKSAEWRAAMSERMKNDPGTYTHLLTVERKSPSAKTREKMAAARRGKTLSAETRARMAAAQRQRSPRNPHSVETRAQMSESAKVRERFPASAETRQKMSDSTTKWHAARRASRQAA